MNETFELPDVGEGLTEAEIVSWKVKPGDTVTVNQVLVEIETAKSLVELPSPHAGTIGALLVEEGATVDVGTPIVTFGPTETGSGPSGGAETPAAEQAPAPQPAAEAAHTPAPPAAEADGGSSDGSSGAVLVGYGVKASSAVRRQRHGAHAAPAAEPAAAATPTGQSVSPVSGTYPAQGERTVPQATAGATGATSSVRALAKPPVRKLARDNGLDLGSINPTGSRGEVTRGDVLAALDGAATAAAPAGDVVSASRDGERETRIPVKGVRKMTAQAMVRSAFTAPHVSLFLDVDATRTMEFVRSLKASGALGEDVRVSPLLVVAKAVLWAAARNPMVNSVFTDEEIVVKNYVNLGIAAATPRGLIVPNIKDADRMTLAGLARSINALVATARTGKTPPAEMAGGTITITNVGVFGVDSGTPILNPGESAIVAFGQIRKRPWVVDGEVVARDVTTLGISADHRVVDGDVASRFLADIGRILEEPALLLADGA